MNAGRIVERCQAMVLAGAVLMTMIVCAAPASAQGQVQERASISIKIAQAESVVFNIPPESLRTALSTFAEQSGWQLFYSAEVAEGLQSQGFSGSSMPEAALKQLLAGTGLDFRITEPRTVTLVEASSVLSPPAQPQEQSQIAPPGTSEAAKPKPVKVPEIVVKDLRKRDDTMGYVADESRSATKTDTPLIEVPQSISVITRKQMTDRNVQTLDEAVRYSAGVQADTFGSNLLNNDILIRGFRISPNGIFRDGLQMSGASGFSPWRLEPYGAQRIEVLRGPASVNYGMAPAGGLINFETKRPTDIPLHEIWLQAGNFNRFQGNFDLSDRIDEKGNWLFRLTGLVRESDTQTDFVKNNRIYIAPAVTWMPRHDTSITFFGFYQKDVVGQIQGYLPASGTLFTNPNGRIPRNRFGGEPSFMTDDLTQYSFGYLLEHRLNDVWTFRQNLRYNNLSGETRGVIGGGLDPADPSQRTLLRSSYHFTNNTSSFQVDSHAQAKFATGPVAQTMLFGVDYLKFTFKNPGSFGGASSINIFNPSHAPPFAQILSPFADSTDPTTKVDQIGLYVQDQMKFYDRLVLTLSGRQDFYTSSTVDATFNTRANENQGRFSGRAGLTYVSSIGIAPYVAYATSFEPLRSTNFFGQPFKPIVGKLIEGGVKYMPPSKDFSLTAAVFELSQENALTPDPANPLNSLQVGEIRHRGFELEGTASLAAGLNMIAAYTYLDPKITQSNAGDQGNRTPQVPINQATAFCKYTVQSGPLAGFGFGPGVRYIGSTFGDTANTVKLPSYVLIDAMADYPWGNYQLAVNASNLFDKTFVASCFSTDACFYGNARVVIATLRYRW